MIELAKWDSEHFGMKVGNLAFANFPTKTELREAMSAAKSDGYDVLYLKGIKLPSDYLSDNVKLADEKVIYSQTINERISFHNENVVSILHRELDARLFSMALQSGGYSRYYTDKKFPINVFLELYGTWIENSLNGLIATDVLAYVEGKRVEGFITYKQENSKVTIGLVDVENLSKGKGIGSILMSGFLSKFPIGTYVEVATQSANKQACHFYEKNGFKIEEVTNIYHLWL